MTKASVPRRSTVGKHGGGNRRWLGNRIKILSCVTSKEDMTNKYKDKGGNESDAKPSFSNISKAKACMLAKAQAFDASSKAKVQECGSKAKLQTSRSKVKLQRSPKTIIVKSLVPITNGVLGLANAETWDAILSKTFGVKIPQTMACADAKDYQGKLILPFYVFCSNDRKGPSKASVPIFDGPSVQGLLDYYGYNDIEEYLSWNYFPSTDNENTNKDITDKDTTDEDCINEYNYIRKRGKERCHMEADHVLVKDQSILGSLTCLHLQASICSLHLQLAFASKHLQAIICILHLQASIRSLHLQVKVLVNQTPLKTAGGQLYPN
ncbi:hypothetical protein Tco_0291608 [Tanacetum coccineum]